MTWLAQPAGRLPLSTCSAQMHQACRGSRLCLLALLVHMPATGYHGRKPWKKGPSRHVRQGAEKCPCFSPLLPCLFSACSHQQVEAPLNRPVEEKATSASMELWQWHDLRGQRGSKSQIQLACCFGGTKTTAAMFHSLLLNNCSCCAVASPKRRRRRGQSGL